MRPLSFWILGGVVEQVGDDLGEPRRVAVDHDRGLGETDVELVAMRVDDRLAGLDRLRDDGIEVDRLEPELDLAAGDARHVEQVVHQPGELPRLALDHVMAPDQLGVVRDLVAA